MDTGKNDRGQEERRRGARRGRVGEALRGLRERFAARRSDRLAPVVDLLALAVALLFSGCHLIFGSYPLAIALLAALPDRVWIALLGAVATGTSLKYQRRVAQAVKRARQIALLPYVTDLMK